MTNQTNASLIATAKAMREQMGEEPKSWSVLALWFETADRLEAAVWQRDNWKMSAEEAERAEKRAEKRAEAWKRLCGSTETATTEVIEERNQLAAVVEEVRAEVTRTPPSGFGYYLPSGNGLRTILATAPADALREHDARVWASGYNAGYSDRSTPGEPFTRNPYRREAQEDAS